ncbi:HAMP domain-containing sensor histidine kinase [Paludibacterium paludis]|uniref:histidine kinase n=1 Tax=Paludibacterium paludis TaxID=1225769 RepID=A0A918UAI3_9NEIS|nr:ATP-binding protein [Paludibacterium paludis]GGY16918.1 two-component sensor histidine kinase [Paludibacterium paludis]
MGRLFWKFFFFIWLAQLASMAGIGGVIWLENRQRDALYALVDGSPPAAYFVSAAAGTLQHGGKGALTTLLGSQRHPEVLAVDDAGRDLMGRSVAPSVLKAARALAERREPAHAVRTVVLPGGERFLLFTARPADGAPPGPPPHRRRPVPFITLVSALCASLIFAALLAAYISRPIRLLRGAFAAVAAGDLTVEVGSAMGRRRDELADLGRDFDFMTRQLRSLVEGQRRLMHDVSHELRSPLARLQAAIGLARQQPARLEDTMQRLERESERMDRLVEELLTLSRLDAGAAGIRAPVDVGELMEGIVEDAVFEASARRVSVTLAGGDAWHVLADASLLHRAIENVVRNALRHAPEGSEVDVSMAKTGGLLDIVVSDRGPGVPDDELESIFVPFVRGSDVRDASGHGLGLAIARRVTGALGGSVTAVNRPGGGLQVRFTLPVLPVQE